MTRLRCPKCGCTKEDDLEIISLSNIDVEIECVRCGTVFYFNQPCQECDTERTYDRWAQAFKKEGSVK